ncbi:hypothetical protein [Streptomyces sp. SID5643]|uniref:hypothetical protein n=1 Tax=Streptomyces sp. SID5643 TaxID=2690307 RepID=UPI0013684C47|nr:hypothetical protein [Streptomyces sp. SID5643]MZF89750.1 hypothetical protein [Streptomyces sp. SID5643]
MSISVSAETLCGPWPASAARRSRPVRGSSQIRVFRLPVPFRTVDSARVVAQGVGEAVVG